MQQQNNTADLWMNDFKSCDSEISDGEEESQHCLDSELYSETERDYSYEYSGPHSSLSCPPSVGPDQDAFGPTSYNMYGPYTPLMKTEVKDNEEVTESFYDEDEEQDLPSVPILDPKSDQSSTKLGDDNYKDYFPSSSYLRHVLFGPNSNLSEVDVQPDSALDGDSEVANIADLSGQEMCSTLSSRFKNLKSLMDIPLDSSSERGMSFEQFMENLDPTTMDQLVDLCGIVQARVHGNDNRNTAEVHELLMGNKNEEKKTVKKVYGGIKKRKSKEAIFIDSDLSDQFSAKKRLNISDQNSINFNLVDNKPNIQLSCAVSTGGSISVECDRVPDIDNVITMNNTSFESHLSHIPCVPAIDSARVRHRSLPDSRVLHHANIVRSLDGTLRASSTSFGDVLDFNGNVMQKNSLQSNSHIRLLEQSPQSENRAFESTKIVFPKTVGDITFSVQGNEGVSRSTEFDFTNCPSRLEVVNNTTVKPQLGNVSYVCDLRSADASVVLQLENMRSDSGFVLVDGAAIQQLENLGSDCDFLSTNTKIYDHNSIHPQNFNHNYLIQNQGTHTEQRFSQYVPVASDNTTSFSSPELDQINCDVSLQIPETVTSIGSQKLCNVYKYQQINNQPPQFSDVFYNGVFQNSADYPDVVTCAQVNNCTKIDDLIQDRGENASIHEVHLFGHDNVNNVDTNNASAFLSRDGPSNLSHDIYNSGNLLDTSIYVGSNLTSDFNENYPVEQIQGNTTHQNQDKKLLTSFQHPNGSSSLLCNEVIVIDDNDNENAKPMVMTTQTNTEVSDGTLTSTNECVLNWSHFPEGSSNGLQTCTFGVTSINVNSNNSIGDLYISNRFNVNQQNVTLCPYDQIKSIDSCSVISSKTDIKNCIPDLPQDADPGLIEARKRCIETGKLTPVVKYELKCAIMSKRHKEGKGDINVVFEPSKRNELTEEEKEKEKHRKELNRVAAANHRQKKKASTLSSQKELADQVKRNGELKETISKLKNERDMIRTLLISKGVATLDALKLLSEDCSQDLI